MTNLLKRIYRFFYFENQKAQSQNQFEILCSMYDFLKMFVIDLKLSSIVYVRNVKWGITAKCT